MRYFVWKPTDWYKGDTTIEFKTKEDRDAWLATNAPDGIDENGTKVESFNQMTYDEWRQWRKEQGYA
jgi:hypothetical protein